MAKKTILIVDDDADYLFQMKLKVQQFGFDTITADSQKKPNKSWPPPSPIWLSSI